MGIFWRSLDLENRVLGALYTIVTVVIVATIRTSIMLTIQLFRIFFGNVRLPRYAPFSKPSCGPRSFLKFSDLSL